MKPEREPTAGGEVWVLSLAGSALAISGSMAVGADIARISHLGHDFAAVLMLAAALAVTLPLSVTMPQIVRSLLRRLHRRRATTRRD